MGIQIYDWSEEIPQELIDQNPDFFFNKFEWSGIGEVNDSEKAAKHIQAELSKIKLNNRKLFRNGDFKCINAQKTNMIGFDFDGIHYSGK